MHRRFLFAAAAIVAAMLAGNKAQANPPIWVYPGATPADIKMAWHAQNMPWHGHYYHTQWGSPVALVVPPNANMQSNYRWGVPSYRSTPIYHQFGRSLPYGGTVSGGAYAPTPTWPSDTTQFGVYYVRAPW